MTDNPHQDPRRDRDNDRDHGTGHDWPADGTRHPGRDRHASPPAGRGPGEDIRHLSESEERDLHFNGYPLFSMQPLHELCYPGGCRYKTEAENCADLETWAAWAEPTAEGDPEAGL